LVVALKLVVEQLGCASSKEQLRPHVASIGAASESLQVATTAKPGVFLARETPG